MGFTEELIAPCGVNCGVCIAYYISKYGFYELLITRTKSGNVNTVMKYSVFIEIVALIVGKSTVNNLT